MAADFASGTYQGWHAYYSGPGMTQAEVQAALAPGLVDPPNPATMNNVFVIPGHINSVAEAGSTYFRALWNAGATDWTDNGVQGAPGDATDGSLWTILRGGTVEEWQPTALPAGFAYGDTPPPPTPPPGADMSTPDGTVDTTTGGGGDFDGGANDPEYRAPGTGVDDADGNAPDTTATPGGSVPDPAPSPATQRETSDPSGGTGAYRTGDVDNSPAPTQVGDTTQLGGGIGATTQQPYRAPSDAPPASNVDTVTRSGIVRVNPGSPDAAVVGDDSGLNPNAVEPGLVSTAQSAENRDTSGYGAPPLSNVPAGTGIPGAPTGVTATQVPNRRAVIVGWTAPANAGTTGVLGYVVESNTHGTNYAGKDDDHIEFEEGLEGGRTYTFTVYARSANGNGYRSTASAPITMPTGDIVADVDRPEGI